MSGIAFFGIGTVMVAFAIYSISIFNTLSPRSINAMTLDDAHLVSEWPADHGCGPTSIDQVMSKPSRVRVSKCAVLLAKACLNGFGYTSAVINLTPRNPDAALDMPAHLIPVMEVSVFWISLLSVLVSAMHAPIEAWMNVSFLAMFSSVSLLGPSISGLMNNLELVPSQCCHQGCSGRFRLCAKVMLGSCYFGIGIGLGIAGFLMKIKSVAFVAEVTFDNWTKLQWLRLALFVNNVLTRQVDFLPPGLRLCKEFMSMGVARWADKDVAWKFWRFKFLKSMVTSLGKIDACILLQSLTEEEARALMNVARRNNL